MVVMQANCSPLPAQFVTGVCVGQSELLELLIGGRLTEGGLIGAGVGMAVGGAHNLALKSDGTLWAWGENIYC